MDPVSFQPSSPVLRQWIDPIRQDLAMSSSIVTKFIMISTDYFLKQQVETLLKSNSVSKVCTHT